MADITEAIRDFLWSLEGESSFELTFSYNKTDYRTVFNAVKKRMSEDATAIEIDNGCVYLMITYDTEGEGNDVDFTVADQMSKIRADDEIPSCFNPVLTTNARGAPRNSGRRTTSGDVLQILKSKLALAFPFMEDEPLKLLNVAKRGLRTFITPFRIVRGHDAYYEKHGYQSPAITKLKAALQSLTWSGCTDATKEIIMDCSGKKDEDYPPDTRLTAIMEEIPWETEVAYNKSHEHSLSQTVFDECASIVFPDGFDRSFVLNPDSEEWKQCDKELVLTGFSVVVKPPAAAAAAVPVKAAGGAGIGRRPTRRARRNKRRSTRRNTQRSTRRL